MQSLISEVCFHDFKASTQCCGARDVLGFKKFVAKGLVDGDWLEDSMISKWGFLIGGEGIEFWGWPSKMKNLNFVVKWHLSNNLLSNQLLL